MASRIKGITVEIGGDTTGLDLSGRITILKSALEGLQYEKAMTEL